MAIGVWVCRSIQNFRWGRSAPSRWTSSTSVSAVRRTHYCFFFPGILDCFFSRGAKLVRHTLIIIIRAQRRMQRGNGGRARTRLRSLHRGLYQRHLRIRGRAHHRVESNGRDRLPRGSIRARRRERDILPRGRANADEARVQGDPFREDSRG